MFPHQWPVVFLQMTDTTYQLDVRGLRCPMPLLKLKQSLHGMESGAVIAVQTSDPGSVRDFQAFLKQAGHELLAFEEGETTFSFRIRKK